MRTVLKAALDVNGYRDRLAAAGLADPSVVDSVEDPEFAIGAIRPMSFETYRSLFTARRPSWKRRPDEHETRSAVMVPYGEARRGLSDCRTEGAEIYSEGTVEGSSSELFRLARALNPTAKSAAPVPRTANDWQTGHAVVVFSGMDAGVLSQRQRDELWARYQVPVFEHLLGTDGRVIASECEVHAGLHLRTEHAILQIDNGELLLTSLTDLACPAIRLRTGLQGAMENEACDCGRTEPRIVQLHSAEIPSLAATA